MLKFRKLTDLYMISQARCLGSLDCLFCAGASLNGNVLSIYHGPCTVLGAGSWVSTLPLITAVILHC